MQQVEFFARLGFFVEPEFLTLKDCARLRKRMTEARQIDEPVYAGVGTSSVQNIVRQTGRCVIDSDLVKEMEKRFLAVMPRLEGHFNQRLGGCQEPQFLICRPGDHFSPHRDAADEPDAADFLKERCVTAVAFVNGYGTHSSSDEFTGGELTFFGLFGDGHETTATPLVATEGLLVAFPASLVHAVLPVTSGLRHTIVSWFREWKATRE